VLKRYIPQPVKTLLKDRLWVWVKDVADRLTGRRSGDIPPTGMMFDGPVGVAEFVANGKEFFKLFRSLIKPTRSVKILDIGSGIGRKTLPLTGYLNKKGSYEGLEIVKKGVDWCRRHITKRFPNFRFTQIDIYNGFYNPKGKIKPSTLSFPYPDNYFDVVIATSVFTHMLPKEVKNYHKEIGRVLKEKGKSYLTYFLINTDSKRRLKDDKNTMPFRKTDKEYWTTTLDTPEIAVAYEEEGVNSFYKLGGMSIKKVCYGSWSGRTESVSYQDIIIATK
jgi:SAM-dependent methyltransferase